MVLVFYRRCLEFRKKHIQIFWKISRLKLSENRCFSVSDFCTSTRSLHLTEISVSIISMYLGFYHTPFSVQVYAECPISFSGAGEGMREG